MNKIAYLCPICGIFHHKNRYIYPTFSYFFKGNEIENPEKICENCWKKIEIKRKKQKNTLVDTKYFQKF